MQVWKEKSNLSRETSSSRGVRVFPSRGNDVEMVTVDFRDLRAAGEFIWFNNSLFQIRLKQGRTFVRRFYNFYEIFNLRVVIIRLRLNYLLKALIDFKISNRNSCKVSI